MGRMMNQLMAGVWMILSTLLTLLTLLTHPSASLLLSKPSEAEIVSVNKPRSLEFAVGSNVTIQCRLKNASRYDVTKMTMSDEETEEVFDVKVVGDDAIETTLYNVTFDPNKVILCQEKQTNYLARRSICVGYPPSADMKWTCRLFLSDKLQCCVLTDQRLDTLCNLNWTMQYLNKTGAWHPLNGFDHQAKVDVYHRNEFCRIKPYSDLSVYQNFTVRAEASNDIATARSIFTFLPVYYAVPGAPESLKVRGSTTDPGSLVVTWYHNAAILPTVCEGMQGLAYRIDVHSPTLDQENRSMVYNVNCTAKSYREEQHYEITGLVPDTTYRVTLTPFLIGRHSGTANSATNRTNPSSPRKAPAFLGWSAGASDGIVVYWKTLSQRDRGGPIISYNVSVTQIGMTSRENFDVGGHQLVTSPRVLQGCSSDCVVTVSSSTVVGASPSASLRIPSSLRNKKMPVVYTERAKNGSRSVSWEGVVNVTSVAWCYGGSFKDTSLIQCQTEVREISVEKPEVTHMLIPGRLLRKYPLCENCQWHFAVRVTDTDVAYENDTSTVSSSDHDLDNVADFDSAWELPDEDSSDFASDVYNQSGTGDRELMTGSRRTGAKSHTQRMNSSLSAKKADTSDSVLNAKATSEENGNLMAAVAFTEEAGSAVTRGYGDSEAGDRGGNKEEVEEEGFETGRLVWSRCQYALDGEPPVPEVNVEGVRVNVDIDCEENAGKPLQAQLLYAVSPFNCSAARHRQAQDISLKLHREDATKGVTWRGHLDLSGLKAGSNYTVCVRVRSERGWGVWHSESVLYKADDISLQVGLLSGLAIFLALFFIICVVCRCRNDCKEKSKHFSKNFTMRNGFDSDRISHQRQHISLDMSLLPPQTAITTQVSLPQESVSSNDSAYEENNSSSAADIHSPPPILLPEHPSTAPALRNSPYHEDSGSEEDQAQSPLLGDRLNEDSRGQQHRRRISGSGGEVSPPEALGLGKGLCALHKNHPTSCCSPEWDDCPRCDLPIPNNGHHCEAAQKQREPYNAKDTILSPDVDSQKQSLAGKSKDRYSVDANEDFKYVKIDSPSHSLTATSGDACSEGLMLPLVQECPETDAAAEDFSSTLPTMSPDGTCRFTSPCGPSGDLKHTEPTSSLARPDSCSEMDNYPTDDSDICNVSTEDISQNNVTYTPLECAVRVIAEDCVRFAPEDHAPKISVFSFPNGRPSRESYCSPPAQGGSQVNPYISLDNACEKV